MSGTEHYTEDEWNKKIEEIHARLDSIEEVAVFADELGLVHKDDLGAAITEGDAGSEDLEAGFDTGIQQMGQDRSEIFGSPSEAVRKEHERLRAQRNFEPDDFTTGMQHSGGESDGDRELTAEQRENLRRARSWSTSDDPDLEEFGTGIQGDMTREERRDREEQIELWAEALKRVEQRRDEDEN